MRPHPLAVLFRQCSAVLLLVSLSTALSLRAQDTRDQTINRAIQAYDVDFDSPRALELLYPSLNPDAGPADGMWATTYLLRR